MIPYMVGKPAPNATHSIRGLVKYVLSRGYLCAVSSQNGENYYIHSVHIITRVLRRRENISCSTACTIPSSTGGD